MCDVNVHVLEYLWSYMCVHQYMYMWKIMLATDFPDYKYYKNSHVELQLEPAYSNLVILNSPLFQTLNHFRWIRSSVIYMCYLELPLF